MPLSDEEHGEIFHHLRHNLIQSGLGAMDGRIMSCLRISEGPHDDLSTYLRSLIEEVSLGSDEQYKSTLLRIRENAKAADGESIRGILVDLTRSEAMRYGVASLDFSHTADVQDIINELKMLLAEIEADWHRRWSNQGGDDE